MKTSVLRDIGLIAVILILLGIIGMLEVRVFISPSNWDICVAPVGTCPKMQHFEPPASAAQAKEA